MPLFRQHLHLEIVSYYSIIRDIIKGQVTVPQSVFYSYLCFWEVHLCSMYQPSLLASEGEKRARCWPVCFPCCSLLCRGSSGGCVLLQLWLLAGNPVSLQLSGSCNLISSHCFFRLSGDKGSPLLLVSFFYFVSFLIPQYSLLNSLALPIPLYTQSLSKVSLRHSM